MAVLVVVHTDPHIRYEVKENLAGFLGEKKPCTEVQG
jgi:hypothetical protein